MPLKTLMLNTALAFRIARKEPMVHELVERPNVTTASATPDLWTKGLCAAGVIGFCMADSVPSGIVRRIGLFGVRADPTTNCA